MKQLQLLLLLLFPIAILLSALEKTGDCEEYDVIIYGGTSAGIAAAVQVKRMGGTVLVVEPTNRIGGLTTGGLGQTDIGNKAAIGGISREFYQRIKKHYDDPKNWIWQKRSEYKSGGQSRTGAEEDTMWTFEPSVALQVMNDLVKENAIDVVYNERLDRSAKNAGTVKKANHLIALKTETGKLFFGKMFIDATYEGDLLASAGVSYIVGREANSQYNESLSGVQTRRATHHQLVAGVDPYLKKGDPKSGLLPNIDPNGPGEEGAADNRVQAYCFRMCLTDDPRNQIPFNRPIEYDEKQYELLFRNFEAGAKVIPWSFAAMPNRKTDVNNNRGFSTDFIGQNYDYPEASYAERVKIIERHRIYQKGFMWTLANHPRVPRHIRDEVSKWGMCKDEFQRGDGWQQQLYIREARRMIGDYVMTQHNCQGAVVTKRPIGLAAYTMDSHHVQRYLDKRGFVKNEGDVQVGGFSPYPIDYGTILPKKTQCDNLVVPICISASHMAFGSIRMEPVFMVLGQSGAIAAMQSIGQQCALQDLEYQSLKNALDKSNQRLIWTGKKRQAAIGILLNELKGIVVDDAQAIRTGFDSTSASVGKFIELGYRHDGNQGKGSQSALFNIKIPKSGKYEVRIAYSAFSNRASKVPVDISHADGKTTKYINQKQVPKSPPFQTVGIFRFDKTATVKISNTGTDGHVLIDAVQLLPVK